MFELWNELSILPFDFVDVILILATSQYTIYKFGKVSNYCGTKTPNIWSAQSMLTKKHSSFYNKKNHRTLSYIILNILQFY